MINVTRSGAPPSLAEKKSWRGNDVLQRLHEDFLGKCYLTEQVVPLSGLEIDHRRPRNQDGADFDWSNLYPASHDANNRRPRGWPEGGLLHPDGRDDVEKRLIQELDYDNEANILCFFAARNPDDQAAINTEAELNWLHNSDKSGSGHNAKDLRDAIQRRLILMLDLQVKLLDARERMESGALELKKLELRFQRVVSRRAPFTALLRSKVVSSLHCLFD